MFGKLALFTCLLLAFTIFHVESGNHVVPLNESWGVGYNALSVQEYDALSNEISLLNVEPSNELKGIDDNLFASLVQEEDVPLNELISNVEPLNELKGLSHNLFASSVQIEIVDEVTVVISVKNLTYDGLGPDVRFWLGKGNEPQLDNGIILLDETGSSKKLHSYQSRDIVLNVPGGVDANDFDLFGLWCVVDQELIGFVPLSRPAVLNRSVVNVASADSEKPYKLIKGFKNLATSDDIKIFKNNTIIIQNLTFLLPEDDYNPYQFRMGRGESLTVQVPFKHGQDGFLFKNEDVAIILFNGLDITYFDTLGIWSESKQFLTKVKIQNELTYLELKPMSRLGHGLKTGPVYALNNKTILIKDIHYDGKGPDAYFWVGNGTRGPNAAGVPIPDENGSKGILKKYEGEDIILKLPGELSLTNIDYIGLWCIQYSSNFGFTLTRNDWWELNMNRHMMFGRIDYIKLDPISSLAHGVKSGPVFILNETTLYINNLFYDGLGPDAHFWVGNGSQGPDSRGVGVADETGSMGILKRYTGRDVMVHLPRGLTVRNIEYFGLWCIQYSHNFGFTTIPKNLQNVPNQPVEGGDIVVNMIQKCCPTGEVKTTKGCMAENVAYVPTEIYEGNDTIFDDEPLRNVLSYPYILQPKCSNGMYSLEQNEFKLLSSGQLLLPFEGEMINKNTFCMDVFKFPDDEWKMTAFLCFPENQKPAFLSIIKSICIYISAFFLILTSLIFLFVKAARDLRGYNVIGFSVSMAISFIVLSTAQIIKVDDEDCSIIGYIYQFFVVLNFTMLCLLNFETLYLVLKFDNRHFHMRVYIYLAIAAIIPFVMMLVSFQLDTKIPAKFSNPAVKSKSCWMRSDKKVVFYYVPIIFSIVLSIIFSVLTLWKIKVNDKNHNRCWIRIRDEIKNVYRSCYIILILMLICWTAEVISYFFETNDGIWIAIDIIECLQGFFVFVVFVMHNPVIGILKAKWNYTFGHNQTARSDADMELTRPNINADENAPFV